MATLPESAVRLASAAVVAAPYEADQAEAERFFLGNFSSQINSRSQNLLKKFLAHPSVRRRAFALEDPACLVAEDQDSRIGRYTKWAVDLAERAARQALAQAGLKPREVTALVVNTCTGYLCPGLTSYLVERLDLPRHIRAYDLVGSGCGGAIPNLQAAAEHLTARGEGVALSLAVEICSATFQMEDNLSLLVSNALFSDGAAAAVLWTRPQGMELVASGSIHRPEDREAIRYVHRRGQLFNQLSRCLPELVKGAVAELVQQVLEPLGLAASDIQHFALHGGGEKIITAVGEALGLPEAKLAPTREVLARYGNMSSPSVLFTLRRILDNGIRPGDWCLMASFGAGLSAHAFLLRAA